MDRILKYTPAHVKKSKAERAEEFNCTGFCKLIEFSANSPVEERNLIIMMAMAALGS